MIDYRPTSQIFCDMLIREYCPVDPSVLRTDQIREKMVELIDRFIAYHQKEWVARYSPARHSEGNLPFLGSVYTLADELFSQALLPLNTALGWVNDVIEEHPEKEELLNVLQEELEAFLSYVVRSMRGVEDINFLTELYQHSV